MTRLLISVRSVAEAETALAGGADIIDVKEPSRGSLGRADDEVIAAIAALVAGRVPVTAALGELREGPALPPPPFQGLVKVGLAGCRDLPDWRTGLRAFANQQTSRVVIVAYADEVRAGSPNLVEVLHLAITSGYAGFLIDTWRKDGCGLLEWYTYDELEVFRLLCSRGRLPFALAGSLASTDIARLLPLSPDLIAVRGAACEKGRRDTAIDLKRVTRLKALCARAK